MGIKKLGRPVGNTQIRRLRSKTWLLAVQSRVGGKNNCQLDIFFGPVENGNRRSSSDRLKMFEAIQKNGSIPGNGSGKRKFDLVSRVESEAGYEGTAIIIHSPFWRLLENEELSLTQVRELVVECVERLNLAQQLGNYNDDGIDELIDFVSNRPALTIEEYFEYQKDIDSGYDLSMANVFPYINPSLDHIALLGALSIEAIYAGNMTIASYHIDIFKTFLKEFCRQKWILKISDELYQYAEDRMLRALNRDPLNGLPDYSTMLSQIHNVNPNSAIDALLTRHQRILWRR